MMNSEREASQDKVLEKIMALLEEERIVREVDKPIDEAVEVFQLKIKTPVSYSDFKRVISEFVAHLHRWGLRLPRHLSDEEAFTEAAFLLRWHYEGVHTKGYDGALLDATSGNLEGLEMVLSRVADSVKTCEREKYVEWVFVSNIDQLDWGAKYQLASAYLMQYEEFLPPQLRGIDPARLTEHLRDLIMNHMSIENLTDQIS